MFRDALASAPDDPDLLVQLGRALNQQRRYDESVDAVRQSLTKQPDHLGALLVLSASASGQDDYATALQAVRHARHLAPNLATVHLQEGLVLLARGEPADALHSLGRARALDPEDAGTVAALGSAHFALRQFESAEEAVADALQLDASNLEAHRLRGLLELRRGGGRRAVETHRTALRLDPTDADGREALAVAMKSRNPVYGLLLRYADWLQGLPGGARWMILLVPFFASRALRTVDDQLWAQVLLGLLVLVVVLSWAMEPLMNSVLLCSSYARHLLPRATRLATYAFVAYLVAAVGTAVVGFAADDDSSLILAMGLAVWAMSAGQTHLVDDRRRRLAVGLQYAGAVLAVVSLVVTALGLWSPAGLLLLAGLVMLWFTAFA